MGLTYEEVDIIETKMLDDLAYWEHEGKEAEKALVYLAGIHDMANAVRKAISDLGGC